MSTGNTDSSSETPLERQDRISRRFIEAVKQGKDERIEDYLDKVPPEERKELLAELIREEHRVYWNKGRLPVLVEYRSRFPDDQDVVDEAFFTDPDHMGVRYALIELLGSGGFGTVYRARDTELGRDVALKVLSPRSLSSPATVSRFEREGEIMSKISHPSIVTVFDTGRFPDDSLQQRFVVMQLVEGQSLRELIRRNPDPVEPLRAARLMIDVAEAIHHVHLRTDRKSAVVHCDLKPENILLDEKEGPHVADFGLAAFVSELHEPGTVPGGTLAYASPEQVRRFQGRPSAVDTRSDVWSLGVILYELLTGKQPFVAHDRNDLMDFIERYQPTAPKDLNRSVPKDLDSITRKCLEKEVNDRPQSAGDLAKKLKSWVKLNELSYDNRSAWAVQEVHLRRFAGRDTELRGLEDWCEGALDGGFCWLVGPPGQGKSALLARFAYDKGARGDGPTGPCLYHPLTAQRNPQSFMRFLIWQASRILEESIDAGDYSADANELSTRLVALLERIRDRRGTAIVILDGLEECQLTDPMLSFLPPSLPERVCFILASPNNDHTRRALTRRCPGVFVKQLPGYGRNDFSLLLERRLEHTAVAQLESSQSVDLERLFERSGGNPLVLSHAIDRLGELLRAGPLSQSSIQDLPSTTRDVLAFIVERIQTIGEDNMRAVRLIAVAMEPISVGDLRELLRRDGRSLTGYQVELLKSQISQYLIGDDRYTLFHQSLAAFVTGEVLQRDELTYAHSMFCEWLEQPCCQGSGYRLAHYLDHCVEAARWNGFFDAVEDLGFLEGVLMEGHISNLISALRRAQDRISEAEPRWSVLEPLTTCLVNNARFLHHHPQCLFQTLHSQSLHSKHAGLDELLAKWKAYYENRIWPGSWIRLLRTYPAPDQTTVACLAGPRAPVLHFAASADASHIAAFSGDGRLYLWGVAPAYTINQQYEPLAGFVPLGFDNTGHYVVAADANQQLAVLRLAAAGDLVAEQTFECGAPPLCAVSAHRRKPARVLLANGQLVTWAGPASGFARRFLVRGRRLLAAGLSPINDHWLAITDDNRVIGECRDGRVDYSLPDFMQKVLHDDHHPSGELHLDLYIAESAKSLVTWFHGLWQHRVALDPHSGWIAMLREISVDWPNPAEDGDYCACSVELWHPSLATKSVLKSWQNDSCRAVALGSESGQLAIGTARGWVHVGSPSESGDTWSSHVHSDQVTSLLWAAADTRLVSSASSGTVPDPQAGDNMVIVHQVEPPSEAAPEVHTGRVTSAAASPDGAYFATGDEGGNVANWDAATGTLRALMKPKVTWLDDDLNVTTDRGRCRIQQWLGHSESVSEIAFTPDSTTLISASEKGTLWLWNSRTGAAVEVLDIDSGMDNSPRLCLISISGDGRFLAALDSSATAVVWSLDASYREVCRVSHDYGRAEPLAIAMSNDGATLATVHMLLPDSGTGADVEHSSGDGWNYAIRLMDVESAETRLSFPLHHPVWPLDAQLRILEEAGHQPWLIFGGRYFVLRYRIWRIWIWRLENGELLHHELSTDELFDTAFLSARRTLRERLSLPALPRPSIPQWRSYSRGDRDETAFELPWLDVGPAWYPRRFNRVVAGPDGRTFCGCYGHEVHFFRVEVPQPEEAPEARGTEKCGGTGGLSVEARHVAGG